MVALAVDITEQVECFNWVDTPENKTSCPAWSIVEVQQTTLSKIQTMQIPESQYVVLTGDAKADDILKQQLVQNNIPQSNNIAPDACTPQLTQIGQWVSWPGFSLATEYQSSYNVGNTCLLSAIADRMRQTGGSDWAKWKNTQNSSGTYARGNIVIPGGWTGWYAVGTAGVGQTLTYRMDVCNSVSWCWERFSNLTYVENN